MTPSYIVFIFGNVFQVTVILLALWKGKTEERVVASALLVNTIASKLSLANQWSAPEYAVLAADTVLLSIMTLLALRTTRWWLMWCSAFQLLIAVTHVAIIVDESVRAQAYRASMIIWAYMVLFALAAGTWGAIRQGGR